MTSSSPRPRRRVPYAIATAALALLAALAPMSAASAHDQLISTDPAADAVVTELPAEITLTYSAELLGDGGSNVVEVTDASGTSLADGAAVVDGVAVTQALTGAASGPITVIWRVVSSDGHPISGEFAFTVDSPAAPTTAPADPTASASPEPMMTTMSESAEPSEPSATTAPEIDTTAAAASPLPWIVGIVVVLAVIGIVLYLLVIRPRRRDDGSSTDSRPNTDD